MSTNSNSFNPRLVTVGGLPERGDSSFCANSFSKIMNQFSNTRLTEGASADGISQCTVNFRSRTSSARFNPNKRTLFYQLTVAVGVVSC